MGIPRSAGRSRCVHRFILLVVAVVAGACGNRIDPAEWEAGRSRAVGVGSDQVAPYAAAGQEALSGGPAASGAALPERGPAGSGAVPDAPGRAGGDAPSAGRAGAGSGRIGGGSSGPTPVGQAATGQAGTQGAPTDNAGQAKGGAAGTPEKGPTPSTAPPPVRSGRRR